MSASDREKQPLKFERTRAPSARELALRAELVQVRHELKALLEDIDKLKQVEVQPVQSAVVTQVVSKTVLMQQSQYARRE